GRTALALHPGRGRADHQPTGARPDCVILAVMSKPPSGFSEDTNSTPLVNLAGGPPGPKRPCLLVVAGGQLGEIFPIEGETVIGRDPEAQIRLADDEGVSRRHAKVVASGEG